MRQHGKGWRRHDDDGRLDLGRHTGTSQVGRARAQDHAPAHLVEVIAGPSGHRNTLMKFSTSHFLQVYTPRSTPDKTATP